MMQIIKQGNSYIEEVEKAYREGYRLYIEGGGSGACLLYKKVFLSDGRNIPLEAFVVDDNYYERIVRKQEPKMCGHSIIPMREIDLEDEHVFLCVGYAHYDFYDTEIVIPKMKGRFLAGDSTFVFDKMGQGNYLDYDYYIEHRAEFEAICDRLADQKSRKVLEAYINQRVSGRFEYLQNLRDTMQYFDDEIVDVSSVNTFVDCGAYTGDTYEQFLKEYQRKTGSEYAGQAYLWEPEPENLKALHFRYDGNGKAVIIEEGVWHTEETLYLSGNGTGGTLGGESSEMKVRVDSIDNVISKPVDFIKMDIEGAEYQAILGAQNTIRRNHPTLAVCVYHKRDDLLRIPDLIQEFGKNYKFYLRAYSYHSIEIVLYAV